MDDTMGFNHVKNGLERRTKCNSLHILSKLYWIRRAIPPTKPFLTRALATQSRPKAF
jgi:hypothetical protein